MHHKVATCCYCGTRAALVLKGETRHELACSACGAPLHDLKMLPAKQVAPARRPKQEPASSTMTARRPKRPKRRKRKGLGRKVLREAFDLIEDIFD